MELTATQEQILDAAMSCIARDGIDSASMRNVAREADVSLGLLSYHFDAKRSLIVAAFELSTSRLFNASVRSLVDVEGADERVRTFIRQSFRGEFLDSRHLALRLALWAISRTDPEIEAVDRSQYDRYAEQLTRLIRAARPYLSRGDTRDRATDVIVTQNGLWLNWARHANQKDLDRGLARCDEIALGID